MSRSTSHPTFAPHGVPRPAATLERPPPLTPRVAAHGHCRVEPRQSRRGDVPNAPLVRKTGPIFLGGGWGDLERHPVIFLSFWWVRKVRKIMVKQQWEEHGQILRYKRYWTSCALSFGFHGKNHGKFNKVSSNREAMNVFQKAVGSTYWNPTCHRTLTV